MMRIGLNPNQFLSTKKISRRNNDAKRGGAGKNVFKIILGTFFLLILIYVVVLVRVTSLSKDSSLRSSAIDVPGNNQNAGGVTVDDEKTTTKTKPETCEFRNYPPRRYYDIAKRPLPTFLQETMYIYGELPQLLEFSGSTSTEKLCVDQSEWYNLNPTKELPFADGTNPSILKINDPQWTKGKPNTLFPSDATYILTICMTNSQCSWKDTPEEIVEYKISKQDQPSTVHTVLLVVNDKFETLQEYKIEMEMDVPKLGKRKKFKQGQLAKLALDDARLFTYQGELWISYREGKLLGYENQVLNKVHFTSDEGIIRLYSSEIELLCCGRNMALVDNGTSQLQALTWVDPITVVDVEIKNTNNKHGNKGQRRKLLQKQDNTNIDSWRKSQIIRSEDNNNSNNRNVVNDNDRNLFMQQNQEQHDRRRLNEDKNNKPKSHFHGTNGRMIHLPTTKEYLGIGHFHRPPERDFDNPYARFGHHYTHSFFTIPDSPPFYLRRLSSELILPSHANQDDGEIIQFWSGLELVDDTKLVLAYGINDCEGAATYLDLNVVEGLLRDVPSGKEVIDLMMPPPK